MFNQKLDETDPFRPVDKSISNRSKTPGANIFGGSDFSQAASTPANRSQSAMPWEATRQASSSRSGTQPHKDLFDVFG